ncbi:MAG: ATP-dependent 6-phosphofructokinase [Acidimicrobiales bacterium]|jgi:6-phosphofructokinase 1
MAPPTGRTIGILTSGGDCAGLNTAIASIVNSGLRLGYTFVGFEKGWEGLLDPVMYRKLDANSVRGINHLGGTILRTTNRGRFAGKVGGKGGYNAIPADILKMAVGNLNKLAVEGLIVIGGDGTLSAAMQLSQFGVPIVGVPKSVDNDLSGTDATFGFSTAVSVALDAMDKIHTTASSHERIFLVECMGRHAGWITLHAGLAGNANAILLPEFDLDVEGLINFLRKRSRTMHSSIIAVAEGLDLGQQQSRVPSIKTSEVRLHGAADRLMDAVEERVPGLFELRTVVLGHTQRGGAPIAVDRLLAKRFGVAAMEAYDAGRFGMMVRLKDDDIGLTTMKRARGLKLVTPADPYYQTARKLGVYIN